MVSKPRTQGDELAALFLHVPLAMIASPLFGMFLGAVVFGLIHVVVHPSGDVGGVRNIFQWGSPALLGLLLNKFLGHRAAYWVGVLGVVGLVIVIAWDVASMTSSSYYQSYPGGPWRYEFENLFTTKCGSSECLEEFLVTAPTLGCVSYSLGAWLGYRMYHTQAQKLQIV